MSLPLANCNPCQDCPPVPAVLTPCPGAEPCEELAAVGCVNYTGDSIVEANIQTGERLDETLQKVLVGMVSGLSCIHPTLSCITALKSTAITKDSISLKWKKAASISAATLQYKTEAATSWSTMTVTADTTKQITGLLANTKYLVKITTTAAGSINCSSVTLAITTKAS